MDWSTPDWQRHPSLGDSPMRQYERGGGVVTEIFAGGVIGAGVSCATANHTINATAAIMNANTVASFLFTVVMLVIF